MTRDQLRLRYIAVLNRHWRSALDRSGPTPHLLDDLATVADEYAVAHAKRVTARRELRDQAAVPVAPDPSEVVVAPSVPDAETAPDPSARTRTRTRRNTE